MDNISIVGGDEDQKAQRALANANEDERLSVNWQHSSDRCIDIFYPHPPPPLP